MTKNLYESVIRPLLFHFPPEAAHQSAIYALKISGLAPFVRKKRWMDELKDSALRVVLGKGEHAVSFPNPVGLAAGFDKNAEVLAGLSGFGFGFLEAGTLTPKPQPGHARPRLGRLPADLALVNHMGFNNNGIVDVATSLARRSMPITSLGEKVRLKNVEVPIGFNIGKGMSTSIEESEYDYSFCHESVFDWADYFVVNVSSPNTPRLRSLQELDKLEPLLRSLRQRNDAIAARRNRRRKPLMFVKVSPDDDPGEELVETVSKTGFDGIVATNTTLSREGLSSPVSGEGGISGRPLRMKSTEIVRRLYRAANGRLTIIGVGGIFDAEDAYEKILAGASLIQVYTGFVYRGWTIARDINVGLLRLLKRDGFSSVQEAIGRKN